MSATKPQYRIKLVSWDEVSAHTDPNLDPHSKFGFLVYKPKSTVYDQAFWYETNKLRWQGVVKYVAQLP
tara:strand:- start:289 stop:495 length:207 start_codon:yes stop_codon:yes gene_type:complete